MTPGIVFILMPGDFYLLDMKKYLMYNEFIGGDFDL